MTEADWPALPRDGQWPATQDYLHLVVQMLGKLKLSLAPGLPEWFGVPLRFGARGLTTGAMPGPAGSVEVLLDVIDGEVRILSSGGATKTIPLHPARPIAEIWADFSAALHVCGLDVAIWDKPQERADATPFSEDRRQRRYDPALARDWFAVLTRVYAEFDRWRSPFFGRTDIGFWWGGFDMSVVLFSGRHAVPRENAAYIMRYDLDAEQLVVGFWPGNEERKAEFYAYLVPEPPACEAYPLQLAEAGWATALGEWILPYEAVRTAAEPVATLRTFMATMYEAAGSLAGWDLEAFTYVAPPDPRQSGRRRR